jgi:integrase
MSRNTNHHPSIATPVMDAFVQNRRDENVKEITIDKVVKPVVRKLLRFFGLPLDANVVDVQRVDDEQWKNFLRSITNANTHNKDLVYVQVLRDFVGKKRLVWKRRDAPAIKPLDLDMADDAYSKIFNACTNDRDRVILLLMRYGGLREGEVAHVERSGFKFDVEGRTTLTFFRTKTNEWSTIRMVEPSIKLREYVESAKGVMFPSMKAGKALTENAIWRVIHELADKVGVTWNPHKFRHYRATEMGKRGFTKWDLDNMFGWSSKTNTASIYVNLSNDETMKKIDADSGLESVEAIVKPKTCWRCSSIIPKETHYCPKCGAHEDASKFVRSAELEKDNAIETMQKQMLEMMKALQANGIEVSSNRETRETEIKKE